jgi:hypothetical protein
MEYLFTQEERDQVLCQGRGHCSVEEASRELHEAVNRSLRRGGVTSTGRQFSEDCVALATMLGAAASRFQK